MKSYGCVYVQADIALGCGINRSRATAHHMVNFQRTPMLVRDTYENRGVHGDRKAGGTISILNARITKLFVTVGFFEI